MSELYWADYLTCDDLYGLRSMRVFLTSRQKMHPVGVEMYDDMMRRIEAGFADASRAASPTPARPAALPVEAQPVASITNDGLYPDRFYIPLPGGWEIQTKGSGSSFRICDTKTGERANVTEQRLHDLLERMGREIHAATAPASPERGDGDNRAVSSTAGTDAADMIVELRTKLQNLIAELPDTRRLLIARTDAEATLKISKSDTQK